MSALIPILHQYAFSPFSEKIRSIFGYKQIQWQSVEIPGLPPRPLLTPLTGGYRRTPVMQIGADIYCDTNIIMPAIDRLFATSASLSPRGSEGVCTGLAFAWERQVWIPTIGVLVHFIGEHIPEDFLKDRKEAYLMIDISKEAMASDFQQHVQFLRAQIAWLERALANRPFLFGHSPSTADFACWQTIFLLRKNCPPDVDGLLGISTNSPITAWYERMLSFGHGQCTEISAQQAFDIAKHATPSAVLHLDPDGDPGGLKAGQNIRITPDDNAKVPVTGKLLAASDSEIVIARQDPEAGSLHIHFPRLGFVVEAI
jgi:glutathione S-transferase